MGLASFNRMRRERKEVEKMEAERFKTWNAQHNGARLDADAVHADNASKVEGIREAEAAATARIGEKVLQGIEEGRKGGVIDGPLRRDHAAEIAGRNLEGVDQPKDPVARIDERIPDETTNEKLIDHTQVNKRGPSKKLVEAAQAEAGVTGSDDTAAAGETVPAAAGPDEAVAPKAETATTKPSTRKRTTKKSAGTKM